MSYSIDSSYLHAGLDPKLIKKLIPKVALAVKLTFPEVDGVAFRGVSGALVAPIIAHKLGLSLLAVRKPDDGSHATGRTVEGDRSVKTYIVIDDFICSGETVKTIQRAVHDWNGAECVGVVCYAKVVGEYEYDRQWSIRLPHHDEPLFIY